MDKSRPVIADDRAGVQQQSVSGSREAPAPARGRQHPDRAPQDFSVLRSYSTTKAFKFDGPKTLTKVRNMLVHPKNAREPYELPVLRVEAWLLSMRYGNQLLLHHLGYTGTFQLNSPNGGWAHTSTRVPWATPVKPTKARPTPGQQGPHAASGSHNRTHNDGAGLEPVSRGPAYAGRARQRCHLPPVRFSSGLLARCTNCFSVLVVRLK